MATQRNYAQQMDAVLAGLGDTRPRLLLHACCGPCSSAVLEQLCRYFEITVLYYNPQHMAGGRVLPPGRGAAKVCSSRPPTGGDRGGGHLRPAAVLHRRSRAGKRAGARQPLHRLLPAADAPRAQYARDNGFDWFTTTLSISPHKDAARINAIGQELEAEFGVKHLPSDFKKHNGYLRSLQLSEQYGLYRQDYCGCEFSAKARGIEG